MRARVALLALLGACGLDQPTDQLAGGAASGGDTPRALFDDTVAPLVAASCASCHVGTETTPTNMFLGVSNSFDSYYAGIIGDGSINGDFNPSSAHLLTEGLHQGPAWNGTQAQAIAEWLEAEGTERTAGDNDNGTGGGEGGGSGGVGAPPSGESLDALDAEQQWAACLSISQPEFTADSAFAIADLTTSNGTCASCHQADGAGGAYFGSGADRATMWHKWQEQLFLTGVFAATTTGSGYTIQIAQDQICGAGTELASGSGSHPAFDCTQTVDGVQPLTALDTYRAHVQAKLDAGACPSPAFAPPD